MHKNKEILCQPIMFNIPTILDQLYVDLEIFAFCGVGA